MQYVGPDQLHGFEARNTTDIYPADPPQLFDLVSDLDEMHSFVYDPIYSDKLTDLTDFTRARRDLEEFDIDADTRRPGTLFLRQGYCFAWGYQPL